MHAERARSARGASIALVVALVLPLGACGAFYPSPEGASAVWRTLPIDSGPANAPHGGWQIGEPPNFQRLLPIDEVRGRWVRFSATVDREDRGVGLRINTSTRDGRNGSIPAVCDGHETMSRCSTTFWLPEDVEGASIVAWADKQPGEIFDPLVEVATRSPTTPAIGHRADALLAEVRQDYYLTDQVDWPSVERTIRALPAPPDDTDAKPAIAQFLRARLPGNKHVVVWTTALTIAPATMVTMPTCNVTAEGVGVLALPGLAQISGDAPQAYASVLHDCLIRNGDARVWVVDLRGNDGGNMYPMIGGLAPLLPIGNLYAFANGHREVTAQVALDAEGVTSNRELVFGARDAGARITAPVIVVFGAHCASSCEQTANAFAARPRTLFVGEPTMGYLTANVPLPINAGYVLLLTTGYTQDPCGRIIEENLSPDVPAPGVASWSIDQLLELPDVRAWLEPRQRDRTFAASATGRCHAGTRSPIDAHAPAS